MYKTEAAIQEVIRLTKPCSEHPKYKAIYRPRVPCVDCWTLWSIKHKERTIYWCPALLQTKHIFDIINPYGFTCAFCGFSDQ